MTTVATLSEFVRRSKRAAEADGLNDVVGGMSLLAITLMHYASTRFQATIQGRNFWETPAYQVGGVLFLGAIILMFATILLSKRGANLLRERFVYPRLGYVAQPLEPTARQKLIRVAVALAVMPLLGAVIRSSALASPPFSLWSSGLLLTIVGVIGGGGYVSYFAKLGFIRHLILGAVCVLTGLALTFVQASHTEVAPDNPIAAIQATITGLQLLTLVIGVSSIAVGAFTFRNLLRTPVFTEGTME